MKQKKLGWRYIRPCDVYVPVPKYYPSRVHGNPRKTKSLVVDSYHRQSPAYESYGSDIGNATKPLKKVAVTKEDQSAHCMAYAQYLYNQFKSGELE